MNCYICDQKPGPGGTRYHVKVAVGICHNCGVAVCGEHSYRAPEIGSLLLCPSCAELLRRVEVKKTQVQAIPHPI
jgi:hypothetical protein